MENPNPYNDDKYAESSSRLHSAIGSMWEAGASIENIEDTISNALEDCDVPEPNVSITDGA